MVRAPARSVNSSLEAAIDRHMLGSSKHPIKRWPLA